MKCLFFFFNLFVLVLLCVFFGFVNILIYVFYINANVNNRPLWPFKFLKKKIKKIKKLKLNNIILK